MVKSREGGEFQKMTEITGEERSYYSSLSTNLVQMQSEVNAFLTQIVEKEKAEKSSIKEHAATIEASNGNRFMFIHSCIT